MSVSGGLTAAAGAAPVAWSTKSKVVGVWGGAVTKSSSGPCPGDDQDFHLIIVRVSRVEDDLANRVQLEGRVAVRIRLEHM
jgi:hypothetical protein